MNKTMLMVPACAALLLVACGGSDAPAPADAVAPAAEQAVAADAPVATSVAATPYAMVDGAPTSGHCALDAVNGQPGPEVRVPAGGRVMFGGWLATAELQLPQGALLVLGNGAQSHSAPMASGAPRPDVAAALGSEALANSGFNLDVDLAGVPAGSYQLVAVLDPTTSAHCPLNVVLVLE